MSDGRRRIYFTSDWHIGHQNVLTLDQRPFKDLDHMHRVLINNYNASVGPDDLCYFLGDIGLCKDGIISDLRQRLEAAERVIKAVQAMKAACHGPHYWEAPCEYGEAVDDSLAAWEEVNR